MYIVVTTKRAADWWIDRMTNAAGNQPSVFRLETGSYRVQHNDLGQTWLERQTPPKYAAVS